MVRNKMPRLGSCSETLIKHIVAFSCCFWVTALLHPLITSAPLFSLPYSPWNSFWVFINFCVCQINISLVSSSYVVFVERRLRCWLQIKFIILEVTYCCLSCCIHNATGNSHCFMTICKCFCGLNKEKNRYTISG